MPNNDSDFLIELGKAIVQKRKAMAYSQSQLAYRIGMEVPNLSVIENGKSNPQLLTLLRIAAALECNLQDLLPTLEKPDSFLEDKGNYVPRKHKKKTPAKKHKDKE